MFVITGSWRSLLVPAALVVTGIVAGTVPSAPAAVVPPAPGAPALPGEVVDRWTASNDAPPLFDVVTELRAIGGQVRGIDGANDSPDLIPAAAACKRPPERARARLRKRLAGWIDVTHDDERPDAAELLELRFGCFDADGLIVDINVDRTRWDDKHARQSRWWILRVTDDDITILAERTSMAKEDWMEWANEGSLDVLGLVDLDRDGARDIVWTRTEHEGGASTSAYDVSAILSATGETTPIVSMTGTLSPFVSRGTLVLGIGTRDDELVYRCVGRDLRLTACAAGDQMRARDERAAVADRFTRVTASELPDRDQLAADLSTLGVPVAARPALLEAVPETTAQVRARRHVDDFLTRLSSQEPLESVGEATHPTAQTYFAELRAELGDSTCDPAVLTDDEITRVNTWIGAQPRPPASPPQSILVEPACGPYVWASWETWTETAGTRHERLLAMGREIATVVAFDFEPTSESDMDVSTAHTAKFFQHGNAIVGTVIHYGVDRTELFAIANERVVERKTGTFEHHTFDSRWSDASDDVITDTTRGIWLHATESGFARVSSQRLRAHESRRAAIEMLERYDGGRTELVRALRVLGAPASLVREVGLPARS